MSLPSPSRSLFTSQRKRSAVTRPADRLRRIIVLLTGRLFNQTVSSRRKKRRRRKRKKTQSVCGRSAGVRAAGRLAHAPTYQSFIHFSGKHVDYIRRAKTIWASNRLLFVPASFSAGALRSLWWCSAVIVSRGRKLCSTAFLYFFLFVFFRALGARSSSFRRCWKIPRCFLVTAVAPWLLSQVKISAAL